MVSNPFEITKAADFDDTEIEQTFVDYPGSGFLGLANPASPMPIYLMGGKGGGRTHLLRHYSFALQKLRAQNSRLSLLAQVQEEEYLGIYLRLTGLNGHRFEGKGLDERTWLAVFAYFMDLSLVASLLSSLEEINQDGSCWDRQLLSSVMDDFVAQAGRTQLRLADTNNESSALRVAEREIVAELARLDRQINLVGMGESVDFLVRSAPGHLLFTLGRIVRGLPGMGKVRLAFLLDELENLTADKQRYVNTLVREKEVPVGFLLGSRAYGFRTHETLSAGEVNKAGSEYSPVYLEQSYQRDKRHYARFCVDLLSRRLEVSGFRNPTRDELNNWFSGGLAGETVEQWTVRELRERWPHDKRPHLVRLKSSIERAGEDPSVVDQLMFENPVEEKLAILLFYREWARRRDLSRISTQTIREKFTAAASRGIDTKIDQLRKHWRADMLAQIQSDLHRSPLYMGLDDFIAMSSFLPRNLLMTAKYVTIWAERYGEKPFGQERLGPMSSRAIRKGVEEAAHWSFRESLPTNEYVDDCRTAIERLGSFLRTIRFSDKPVEVSCASFSVTQEAMASGSREVLDQCEKHGLLVSVPGGRKDRNTGLGTSAFQLSPMISPLFGLPLARRGILGISIEEANAIFDPEPISSEFLTYQQARRSRLNAPFSAQERESDLSASGESLW